MSTSRIFGSVARLIPFALVAIAATVACSTSTMGSGIATEPAPAEPAPAEKADAAPETPAPKPKKDAAPPEEPPAGECSSEASQTSCVTCCSNKHEDGAAVYFVALIDCMCLEANCAKECELTLCDPDNPKNADAECQTCVQQKNSACSTSIKNTCTADPDCTAFDACVGKSDCPGKAP